jgi:peptidoglycan/LPS O-acetylase OafA/YrhL
VMLYHVGLPVHGGFVGVDVFFVISGFLISSIILRQTQAGTFTFAGFYERRTRRIFPALFVMLAGTSALAYRYLLPGELEDFARSLLAANFSASNFYFWLKSGYFDAGANSNPLLHTWSLAVEEQFYIGLPVLFWFLKRFAPSRLALSVILLALASFVLSVVGAYQYPTATFYLAPTRTWELLLGGILSLESFPRLRNAVARELASIAGMGLIVGSSLFYNVTTVFPGLTALAPCGGAALIIVAGRDGPSWLGRLLSLKPVRFIGLISYSLYLWHWPVIVFYGFGMTMVHGLTRHGAQALMCAVALVLGAISWRFVEQPFRLGGALSMSRTGVFRLALAGLASIALVGSLALCWHGIPSRFSVEARRVASYRDEHSDEQYRTGTCFMTPRNWTLDEFDARTCMPDDGKKPKLLILGDSHAAHLWWGMNIVLPEWNVMQATSAGCKPVVEQRPRQFPGCTRLMDYVLKTYLPSHRVDTLLLEAHWDPGDVPSLSQTMDSLRSQHVHVVLLGPMLQYDAPLPRLLAMSMMQEDPSIPAVHRVTAMSLLDGQMADAARGQWQVPYVSMIQLLCDGDVCLQYAGPSVPLLSDYGHLTKEGSILVAKKLRDEGWLR